MGDTKTEGGVTITGGKSDASKLRGRALEGSEQRQAVDHTAYDKTRNTDSTLRLDGEEDTLYDDGLEVDDNSPPLTGKDGRDDTQDTE
ncbi:MAG: hypothetical protein M3N91_00115 [Pseudomonadota bacterium]|nr:hypothetical protein [Pseudomonadota bacterium]